MEIHLVYFVKTCLIKHALIPQLIKMSIHLLCKIVAYELLDFKKFFFSLNSFKHMQQINLSWIEYSCFHNCYCFEFCCKYT